MDTDSSPLGFEGLRGPPPDQDPLDTVGSFPGRFVMGIHSLTAIATVSTFTSAPFSILTGQIPLPFGFSISTPISPSPRFYQVGEYGQSQSFQWGSWIRGQDVVNVGGFSLRTHTTGLLDWGTRRDIPGFEAAVELVHPGRAAQLHSEVRPVQFVFTGVNFNITPNPRDVQAADSARLAEPREFPAPSNGSITHGFQSLRRRFNQ
jgi:hypothetical protein